MDKEPDNCFDRICPTPWSKIASMRRKNYFFTDRAQDEVIAVFGGAQLVKHLDGRLELRGGSPAAQQAAKEWIAQFMQDRAVTLPPAPFPSKK